jgi:hypothetical protein
MTVAIGDVVTIKTEDGKKVNGLVCCVHNENLINAVFISPEPAKSDSYGRQVDRYSSLQHYTQNSVGRYWQLPQ